MKALQENNIVQSKAVFNSTINKMLI